MKRELKIISIIFLLLGGSTIVYGGLNDCLKSPVKCFIITPLTKLVNDLLGITGDKWKTGEGLLGLLVWGMTWNPDMDNIKYMMADFIELLMPLYIVALILTGFYLFFITGSPQGRARAKAMLLKLFISMTLVMAAPTLFGFLLDISAMLVNWVLNMVVIDFSPWILLFATTKVGLIWLLILALILILVQFVFIIRYIFLFIMGAMFPIIIFLFFFELTRGIGKKLMRYTLATIFVPAIQAFFLMFSLTAITTIGSPIAVGGFLAKMAISLGGFVLMLAAPLMALELLKWVGGMFAYAAFSQMGKHHMRASGLFFLGGLMQGEGASAISMAATIPLIHKLEHISEHMEERMAGRARHSAVRKRQGGKRQWGKRLPESRKGGRGSRGGAKGAYSGGRPYAEGQIPHSARGRNSDAPQTAKEKVLRSLRKREDLYQKYKKYKDAGVSDAANPFRKYKTYENTMNNLKGDVALHQAVLKHGADSDIQGMVKGLTNHMAKRAKLMKSKLRTMSASDLILEGDIAFKNKDYKKALEFYEHAEGKASASDVQDFLMRGKMVDMEIMSEAVLGKGKALAAMGNYDGAVSNYKTAIQFNQNNIEAHSRLADVLYKKG